MTAAGTTGTGCGAAGIRMGWALVEPGRRTRGGALLEEARRAFPIVLATITAIPFLYISSGYIWMLSAITNTDGFAHNFAFSPRYPVPRVTTRRM